jgi:hypothetical protein
MSSVTYPSLLKMTKIPRLGAKKFKEKHVGAEGQTVPESGDGGGAAAGGSIAEILPQAAHGKSTGIKLARNEEQERVPKQLQAPELGKEADSQSVAEQASARSPTPEMTTAPLSRLHASRTVGVAGVNGVNQDADSDGMASMARGAKPHMAALTSAEPVDRATLRADFEGSLSGSSTEPSEAGKLEEGVEQPQKRRKVKQRAGSDEEEDAAGEDESSLFEAKGFGWNGDRCEPDRQNAVRRVGGEDEMEMDGDRGDFEWVGGVVKSEEGRRYYSSLRTPAGVEVPLGSTIFVYAPRDQPPFLAKVEAMWENESDQLKQYRCRWFFRPNQAFQASALQEAQQLQHPREVFYSDELDVNYVNTIHSRTIVVHRDSLPPNFNLDSLRVGDHFFYRSKYDRKTRHFVPVDPPRSARPGITVGEQEQSGKGSGARGEAGEGEGHVCAVQASVLAGDLSILLQNSRVD